jgi:hypothetical protein
MNEWLEARGTAVRIRVRARPRASRTKIADWQGGVLRIRVAAPPVEGEANRELVRFLAKAVGVAPSRVRIVSRGSGRTKTIEIDGVTEAAVRQALSR